MEPGPENEHETELYVIAFSNDEIHTTVTSDPAAVERWINEIERPNIHIVGVGIKFGYDYRQDWVATLQLCVGSRCLIYLLEFVDYDFPDILLDFLENTEYTFVGWFISDALTGLEIKHGLHVPRALAVDWVDLVLYRSLGANLLSEYILSDDWRWAELVERVLGREVEDTPEEVLLLRWDHRLTFEQVKCACFDAFVAFEMGRVLNARQFRLRDV